MDDEVDVPSISEARAKSRLRRLLAVVGGTGKPPALIYDERTLKQIVSAGRIQCTQAETAAVLGFAEATLIKFFDDWPEAKQRWEIAREGGKRSLRRKQYEVALKGNPTMLIWTGKQYLGQSDKTEVATTLSLEALVLASVKAGPVRTEDRQITDDSGSLAETPPE